MNCISFTTPMIQALHDGRKTQTRRLMNPQPVTSAVVFPARVRELATEIETAQKVPPNDPLVVRFVNGGALVVAAWGDEAAELNDRVKALKI
jgi:hypothetical protein